MSGLVLTVPTGRRRPQRSMSPEAVLVSDEALAAAEEAALSPFHHEGGENPYTIHRDLQETMNELVGIIRNESEVQQALDKIEALKVRAANLQVETKFKATNDVPEGTVISQSPKNGTVDIGGTMPDGYCSDETRTYSVGEPPAEFTMFGKTRPVGFPVAWVKAALPPRLSSTACSPRRGPWRTTTVVRTASARTTSPSTSTPTGTPGPWAPSSRTLRTRESRGHGSTVSLSQCIFSGWRLRRL